MSKGYIICRKNQKGGDSNPRNQSHNVKLEDGRTNSDPEHFRSACGYNSSDTYKGKGVVVSDSNNERSVQGMDY